MTVVSCPTSGRTRTIADVASIPTRIRALEAELRALRRLAVDELVRAMVTTIAAGSSRSTRSKCGTTRGC